MLVGFHAAPQVLLDGQRRPSLHFLLASFAPTIASLFTCHRSRFHLHCANTRGKQASVEVPGNTVAEALAGLVAQHPDLKKHLYADDGKLRAFVNVYVNDEDMRYLQKEATALKDGDTISIVPSIAGGCNPVMLSED
jgi:sulfur-carrier protein